MRQTQTVTEKRELGFSPTTPTASKVLPLPSLILCDKTLRHFDKLNFRKYKNMVPTRITFFFGDINYCECLILPPAS